MKITISRSPQSVYHMVICITVITGAVETVEEHMFCVYFNATGVIFLSKAKLFFNSGVLWLQTTFIWLRYKVFSVHFFHPTSDLCLQIPK